MINLEQLKKLLLQHQIGQNQMQKANDFDIMRAIQTMQMKQAIMQKKAQEELMKRQNIFNLKNLDTPAARELFQVKQLLAQRDRPKLRPPVDMTNAFNQIMAEKLMY